MATTLDSQLQRDTFLFNAMKAFKEQLIALSVFSIGIRDAVLEGTDKVIVPFHPLHGTASKDFVPANGYVFDDDGVINAREVTVDKRKYQPLAVTSANRNRQPMLDLEGLAAQKGARLAKDVVEDILSFMLVANFGAAVLDTDATAFTKEDVIDLGVVADEASWPEGLDVRTLVMKSAFMGNVLKDATILDQSSYGSLEPIRQGRVRELGGFSAIKTEVIPANGEDLVGFIAAPSAMLVAFAPIVPEERVMKKLDRYEQMTDDETGLVLEFREWGDPDLDTGKETLEINYGYDLGDAAALKLIKDTP